MDTKTLMWIISGLLAVITFFMQDVWRRVKRTEKDIQERTLIINCDRTHKEVDKYLHQHADTGGAGEAMYKR